MYGVYIPVVFITFTLLGEIKWKMLDVTQANGKISSVE
jgi:hypothetical protein